MIVKSLDHLELVSQKIGDNLSKSDCIFLIGEIGVGKTTFTRNLIHYLQKKEKSNITEVLSPTFNLLHEYELKKYKIMHYDFYRIRKKKEINQLDVLSEKKNEVLIIEWPKLLKNKIKNKLEIYLSYRKNDNERMLKFKGFGKWKNFKNEF